VARRKNWKKLKREDRSPGLLNASMTVTDKKGEGSTDDLSEQAGDAIETSQTLLLPTSTSISPTKEDAVRQWQQWVPMDQELYIFLHTAQVCMLQKIHEMFHQADIPYWICGGTLIGAIRHGGLIPHDDDVDIECFAQDLDKISQLPLDHDFYTNFIPLKGTWKGHPVGKLEFFHGMLEVDVFPRPYPLPPGDCHFASQDEVFPRSQYQFHNITVWGPNADQCGAYLDRCYGPDWRDHVCVYNHDFNWYHGAGFDPRRQVLPLYQYEAIVQQAGIDGSIMVAESSARATFDRLMKFEYERISEMYQQYRRQRVFRWNRAAAEYRERLQEQDDKQPTS
jgi:LicD family